MKYKTKSLIVYYTSSILGASILSFNCIFNWTGIELFLIASICYFIMMFYFKFGNYLINKIERFIKAKYKGNLPTINQLRLKRKVFKGDILI